MSVVLITGARLPQAHALKRTITEHRVIMGDYYDLPTYPGSVELFLNLPSPHSPSYIHQFLALCLKLQVSKVCIVDELEYKFLEPAKQLFVEYAIDFEFVDGVNTSHKKNN
ncbi:MAG: hypothetical protein NT021_02440 [Sphingobacteriales bacterium]|jgi:hypothetical protein|nr:hypothetical protein [Sphingobacteriales bacterium]